MLQTEGSEASERMSSKAVDVRAKPTLREQYFTDRSGIALAAFLSLALSLSWSAALVTCQVASTWKDLLASLWNEERAYSFDERGEVEEGGIDSEPGITSKFASFRNKVRFPIWVGVKEAHNRT